jgi:anaerobic ribonucleoside-triphosphate reductase activating protein
LKTTLGLVSDAATARVAQVVPATGAEGPGVRFAVWFQGCPLRCPGCCNPEFLPFTGGTATATDDLAEQLRAELARTPALEGVSLLGGEPFAHPAAGLKLAEAARDLGLSVMIYSGYTLDDLRAKADPDVHRLLALTDVLVDGPYRRELPDTTRRWVGSTNQGVHLLTERYAADAACWRQSNTLEVRVVGNEVTVNGFPALGAVGLWKGWKRPTPRPTRPEDAAR